MDQFTSVPLTCSSGATGHSESAGLQMPAIIPITTVKSTVLNNPDVDWELIVTIIHLLDEYWLASTLNPVLACGLLVQARQHGLPLTRSLGKVCLALANKYLTDDIRPSYQGTSNRSFLNRLELKFLELIAYRITIPPLLRVAQLFGWDEQPELRRVLYLVIVHHGLDCNPFAVILGLVMLARRQRLRLEFYRPVALSRFIALVINLCYDYKVECSAVLDAWVKVRSC